jgi:hypothetical protein
MTTAGSTLDSNDPGNASVTSVDQADARFLRRILIALIVSTLATGVAAAYASAASGQFTELNFALSAISVW